MKRATVSLVGRDRLCAPATERGEAPASRAGDMIAWIAAGPEAHPDRLRPEFGDVQPERWADGRWRYAERIITGASQRADAVSPLALGRSTTRLGHQAPRRQ